MYWKDAAFVLANKIRIKILEILGSSEKPMTPSQIDKVSGIPISNVSTKLLELKKKDLVKCLNPDAKKFRLYVITTKGKQVLEKTNGMKE